MEVSEDNITLMSKTIGVIRFPLIVGILFIHTSIGNHPEIQNIGWWSFLYSLICDSLPRFCVPTFFMISGFLFFANIPQLTVAAYWAKLKRRFRSLFIPYLFWNGLFLAIALILTLPVFKNFAPGLYRDMPVSFRYIVESFWVYKHPNIDYATRLAFAPIDMPLWFVRDLMVTVLFAPLIWWMSRHFKVLFLAGLVLMKFVGVPMLGGYSFDAFYYFAFGSYLAIHNKDVIGICKKFRLVGFLYLLGCLLRADSASTHFIFDAFPNFGGLWEICGVVSSFYITSVLCERIDFSPFRVFEESTFFVLAFHFLFIYKVASWVVNYFDMGAFSSIVFVVIYPFISALFCVGVYLLFKRSLPCLCRIACGSR